MTFFIDFVDPLRIMKLSDLQIDIAEYEDKTAIITRILEIRNKELSQEKEPWPIK